MQAMFPDLISFGLISVFPLRNEPRTPPPFSRLQCLKLEIPSLPAAYIEYLTNHLSDLIKLKIKMTDTLFDDWVKEIGEYELLEFATRLSETGHIKLAASAGRDRIGRRMDEEPQQQQPSAESKITFFYTLLNNTIGHRDLSYCGTEFQRDSYRNVVSIKLKDDSLLFDYMLDEQQQHQQNGDLSVPLPDKSMSMAGHEIIDQLVFKVDGRVQEHHATPQFVIDKRLYYVACLLVLL
jgi:hypothetical protein